MGQYWHVYFMLNYLDKRTKNYFFIQDIQIARQEASLKGFPKSVQVSVRVT